MGYQIDLTGYLKSSKDHLSIFLYVNKKTGEIVLYFSEDVHLRMTRYGPREFALTPVPIKS